VFERIVTQSPRMPAEATPPLLASVACHVVLAVLVAGLVARATHTPEHEPATREAMLLLPLLPSSAPPRATALTWEGGTSAGNGPAQPRAGEGRGLGIRRGSGRRAARTIPGVEPGPEDGGGVEAVYAYDAVLDRPVSRHPLAGAPEYPPALLAARIEGHVLAEFTVDEQGRADSASLVIAETTHPGFTDALRAAMGRLRFLPAEHQGRPVRQRVEQRYIFKVEIVDTVRTST
jgi:protein TonB